MNWRNFPSLCLIGLGLLTQTSIGFAELDPEIGPLAEGQIVRFTDRGVSRPKVILQEPGSSVFFLNDTSESLTAVEIDFGEHLSFCASGKMRMDEAGVFRSMRPFAPRSFVAVCFPEVGSYPVTVFGLPGSRESKSLTVQVVGSGAKG